MTGVRQDRRKEDLRPGAKGLCPSHVEDRERKMSREQRAAGRYGEGVTRRRGEEARRRETEVRSQMTDDRRQKGTRFEIRISAIYLLQ